MTSILDEIIIRISFVILLVIALVIYKYAHYIFYPIASKQVKGIFFVRDNTAQSMHFFSRLVGISLLFSSLNFSHSRDLLISMLHFMLWGGVLSVTYLVTVYIVESIIFYNFDFHHEIIKKKNHSYAVISSILALCSAFTLKEILNYSDSSLKIFFIIWLFSMVIWGILLKLYPLVSKLNFNNQVNNKNVGIILSFGGYAITTALIVQSSLSTISGKIIPFLMLILIKLLLAMILFPIFQFLIKWIFRLSEATTQEETKPTSLSYLGYATYEGASFLIAGLLISILVGKIILFSYLPSF